MRFAELIKKLSEDLEYKGNIPANGKGGHTLLLDNNLRIDIDPYTVGAMFSCYSIEAPKQKLEEFYTHALLANLYGQGTNGALLGLYGKEDEQVYLRLFLDQTLDYPFFKEKLDEFILALDFWKDEVATF